ncbi:hypothetical protein PQX77_001871 [Marasmius sp. AFHP31]|nr:hypothetical protein PQX77_001871 [Marasmius sp. AFHP31]
MPLFLLGGGPALDSPVSYDSGLELGDDPFGFVNINTVGLTSRPSEVNLRGTGSDSSSYTKTNTNTNYVAFPTIQTPSSGPSSSESIATTESFSTTTTTTPLPSGAVVPRAAPTRSTKKKKPSFTDRRGYNLCIDLSGTAKRFGNHSGRQLQCL